MFSDFAGVCFDGIVNELAKFRYMTGGQVTLPVTIRLGNGAAGFAAQHSQPVENWFLNIAGAEARAARDPGGRLRPAARGDRAIPTPVLVFEHSRLYRLKGELPTTREPAALGRAEVVRSGTHVTVVATQLMRHRALEAAERLAARRNLRSR